jgi:hypothetical protein
MLRDSPGGGAGEAPPITDVDRAVVRLALDLHRAKESGSKDEAERLAARLRELKKQKRVEKRDYYRRRDAGAWP